MDIFRLNTTRICLCVFLFTSFFALFTAGPPQLLGNGYAGPLACDADFSANVTTGCAPLPVQFSDHSAGAVSWYWNFPGGNPSSYQGQIPPVITYNLPGTYSVSLTIDCRGDRDVETKTRYINVTDCTCLANFTADKTSGCAPLPVNFTDQSTGAVYWAWSFPGGTPGSYIGQNPPAIVYQNPGTYSVTLNIECLGGSDIETKTAYITVNSCKCNAEFTANRTSGCVPLDVTFTDKSTGAVSWKWFFPGGDPAGYNGKTPPVITYNAPGIYDVRLEIECAGGTDKQNKKQYIEVLDCDCTINWTADYVSQCAPGQVVFVASGSGIQQIDWSFPGGQPAKTSGFGPHSITYANPGNYEALLVYACQGAAQSDSILIPLSILDCRCQADFEADYEHICMLDTVTFFDHSINAKGWYWYFPGGEPNTASGPGPHKVNYNKIGIYDVTLEIECQWSGDVEQKKDYIYVAECHDFGDAPDPPYQTLWENGGPYCGPMYELTTLGMAWETDHDGQPDAPALGDDNDGEDDEDGVFSPPLVINSITPIKVVVFSPCSGFLNGWIDFYHNGNWTDAGEHVIQEVLVTSVLPDTLSFPVKVPADATPGETYARFRLSNIKGIGPNGWAPIGEVEDHLVVIKEAEALYDLGDTPDGTNSYTGFPMTAYPLTGVTAYFPTVYGGPWPYGPVHRFPRDVAFLGDDVSLEQEADTGPDEDPSNNIDPQNDAADLDIGDDGVVFPLNLKNCQLNTLDFIVNVKSIKQDTFYVLVWFDWNRDGCWGGNLVCPDGSVVSEAAVFNQKIVLTSTGKHLFTTKPFYAWIPDEGTPPQPIWMRITLAERPYVFNPENIAHNGIGEGPKEGYLYGETEDYCFTPGAGEGDLDWGDAYDTPDSPAYPTLKVNNGANHHIRGPWLGDNNDYPDADSDGQPGLFALGDDLQNRDDEDGVKMPFLLIGQTVNIPVTVNGGGGIIDAWIEFDKILGWSPEEKVFSGYFPNGDHMIPFLIPPGALQGRTLTRFRISSQGGLAPDGPAEDGEVEDHLAWIEEPPHGMKAPQWPELRPHGIDVRVDATRLIADDWQCAKTDTITDLHLWGSWKNDEKGKITSLWVGFYDNFTPAVASDGGYPENLLWHKEFRTDDFTETLYHTVTEPGEYWWDPFTGNLIKGGDTQVWRLDIEIDPKEAFIQNGKPNAPILYWICIQAKTEGGMFGWKTRWRPEQFNSTAVFATGNPMGSPSWTHLSFPFGHPFAEDRIDMSFILTTRKKEKEAYDFGDAPDPSFPTYLSNNGARHAIDPLLYLGSQIDDEPDGQPDNAASGDDMHGLDDEDGVVFNTPLYLGDTVKLTVTTSDSGVLNAWIDFNNNGSWGDAGEQVFVNQQLGPGQNDLSIVVPGTATTAEVCARFRFSRVRFLNYDGPAPDGEVEDYKVLIEKPGEGATKWSQPPLHNRHSPFPDCYWGWDEPSFFVPINGRRTNQPSFFVESVQDTFRMQFVADDWFCKTVSPITGIRWWGSYRNWRGDRAPENAPPFFRIGIWTDVPALEERPWSHPGVLIWEYTVSRSAAHETLDSCDYIPDIKHLPDSTFRYTVFFPHSNWFIQQPDSSVFWLSITALYDRPPDSLVWGWKTRDHYFQDDAVRVFVPSEPSLDESFQEGEPVAEMWDMAFELFTDLYEMEFDFGDAPDPGYATLRKSNGAQHYIVPGISLGQRIDAEPDGQPDAEARGDNRSGSNDEDGVTFVSDLVAGRIAGIEVQFPATGILNAWIDFNGDSLWDAPEEHVIADVKMAAGRHALEFHVPGNAVTGSTFARFRFSTVSPRSPKGIAIDGEVEDYLIKILPTSVERKQEKEHLPAQFMLWQNYPNPFNPSTEIRYDLPRDVSVRISIYNLIGHELCVLVYKPHRAGYYTVTWNGKDDRGRQVPSGIYIYRLTAGEFTAMRKLVFVK